MGIASQAAQRLFDVHPQASAKQEGFGVGLGSARRMAGLMGGVAGLDPRWGQGAAFFLELEAAR